MVGPVGLTFSLYLYLYLFLSLSLALALTCTCNDLVWFDLLSWHSSIASMDDDSFGIKSFHSFFRHYDTYRIYFVVFLWHFLLLKFSIYFVLHLIFHIQVWLCRLWTLGFRNWCLLLSTVLKGATACKFLWRLPGRLYHAAHWCHFVWRDWRSHRWPKARPGLFYFAYYHSFCIDGGFARLRDARDDFTDSISPFANVAGIIRGWPACRVVRLVDWAILGSESGISWKYLWREFGKWSGVHHICARATHFFTVLQKENVDCVWNNDGNLYLNISALVASFSSFTFCFRSADFCWPR